jgi:predicted aldo/keto reductase-like oxidoreductase
VKSDSSRRNFLAAGLALPAAGLASTTSRPDPPAPVPQPAAPAPGQLSFRVLGKTGLKVTTVGYGCMITSDPTVITRAADMGINYFDTSRNYQHGQNERMVGTALGAKRKDIVLSSKVDATSKAGALEELNTSLKELGTDHLDIWHLHGKDNPGAISDELVDAELTAKQQGKIRFTAVSTHQLPKVVDRILEAKIEVVTAAYNFTMDPSWGPAIDKLHAAGVGVVGMKVMAGGMRGRNPRPQMQRPDAPAAALKWVLKNPRIATTIPSMTDNDQLEHNFRVMAEQFSDADAKILTARLEEIRPSYCRMCGKCEGQCPKGLPVANMLRFVMYADGYGQFALGREHFQTLSAEHQAVRCGDCETCAIQCPNGVRVAERLMRAQSLFA